LLQCSKFQHWFWRWTSGTISFKPTNLILLFFTIWTGITLFQFLDQTPSTAVSAISERSYFSLLIWLMIIVCTRYKNTTKSVLNYSSFDFFLTLNLTTRLIQKFMLNIIFLLWLALLTKVLREWLKFDYVCILFLNKAIGQTWGQKSQTNYNLERREYKLMLYKTR